MTITKTDICVGAGAIGGIAALAGFVAFIISARKMNKMANKVGMSVEEIKDSTKVEVADSIVNTAVTEAVNEQAEKKVDGAISKVVENVRIETEKRAQKEANACYQDLRSDMKKRLKTKVEEVDIRDVKREVVDDAKRQAKDAFTEGLDDVKRDFKNDLNDALTELKSRGDEEMKKIMDGYRDYLRTVTSAYESMTSAIKTR